GECPPTKTGAAMVTLPSYSMCASIGQGIMGGWSGMNMGNEPPVAVLWGGREFNPSSIRVSIDFITVENAIELLDCVFQSY
ncbi:unnamed protein product, partial [Rotaria magnacalcarata]